MDCGWKILSISKMRAFPLLSTESEDSLLGSVVTTTEWSSPCWSSFSTGFTRHSTRMLPANRELAQWCWFYLVRPVWTFQCYTFKLHQLLVILPAQCDFFPVFLQEIFVGFRHLTNSSWNLQHQKTKKKKQNPKTLHHETFWFGQIGKFIKHSSQGTTYLFFCFADSCSIKLWEISNLAPQAGVVCLHRA